MSESDGHIVTIHHEPKKPREPTKLEVTFTPGPDGVLPINSPSSPWFLPEKPATSAGRLKKRRMSPKALKRRKHLRGLREVILHKAPKNATNRELADYFERAGYKPDDSYGVSTYPDIWKRPKPQSKKLQSKFRKDKSAALKLD